VCSIDLPPGARQTSGQIGSTICEREDAFYVEFFELAGVADRSERV
jgi:hypothetical protein